MLRIATYNLQNLGLQEDKHDATLDKRIPILRTTLERLDADIICFQEVDSQQSSNSSERELAALDKLLDNTKYQNYNRVCTKTTDGQCYHVRNLVIVSGLPIKTHNQYNNDLIGDVGYKIITEKPANSETDTIGWERPILHAQIELSSNKVLHLLNLHLKSKLPTNISGQMVDDYTWKSASGWAEGFYLSSMKWAGPLKTGLI
jgi:endonuclease/exonuclease/phosphatase family metal-dependent hydrolase